MPVSLKYTWEETQHEITITIPFRGQSAKKVDLFVADVILKVSYHQYLLDINLAKKIRTNTSKALLKDGYLIIHLEKENKGLWHHLVFDGSKEESRARRNESLHRREREIQKQHENARSKKVEEERMAVRMQMNLDSDEIQRIQDLKNEEKLDAEEKLYKSIAAWNHAGKTAPKIDSPLTEDNSILQGESKDNAAPVCNQESIKEIEVIENDEEENDIFEEDILPIIPAAYPTVRGASCIRFKHTPRIFKTPVRESTVLREKEFLIKNRPFLKYNKHFNTECTDVSDADPMWLKRKGDEFYVAGDYASAINAYTEAFEKDECLIQALTNRSACYLYIGEAQRCILDSEEVLTLITNHQQEMKLSVAEIKLIRKKVLIRVANAHCQSGGGLVHFQRALNSLKSAQDMDVSDSLLSHDIERVSNIIEALKLKVEADKLLSEGKIDDAIERYDIVLSMEPTMINAKINSATAHLLKGCYKESALLCEQVLEVFKSTGPSRHGVVPPLGTIPFPGSERRRKMVIACLYKRAEAFAKLLQFDEAIVELQMIKFISSSFEDTSELESEIIELKKQCDETKMYQ